MREIKFKAKRIDNNKWVYGKGLIQQDNNVWIVNNSKISINFDYKHNSNKDLLETKVNTIEVKPETVCQFTGMQDKNKKDIYENDKFIVENGDICIIKYQNNLFVAIVLESKEKHDINRYEFWCNERGDGLILSNTFDGD